MSLSLIVLAASIVLQTIAAVLAVRLISLTKHRKAWLLIASALSLMAIRRSITLAQALFGDSGKTPDLTTEWVALAISGLMLVGVSGIREIFVEFASAEEKVRRVQKLKAVGTLAGGVAHDFNNILQAMMSQTQLLKLRAPSDSPELPKLEELETLVRRGASITRQLLLFSKRSASRMETLDLGTLVSESMNLLRRLLPENVAFERLGDTTGLYIQADHSQIEQVLMNLSINAAHAMPGGGTLTLRTRLGPEMVVLEVQDTGTGIPDEIVGSVFEPFFTTKEGDQGTGLGLSVVHGIVEQHGGTIDFESQAGVGTCFRVRLPRALDGVLPGASPQQLKVTYDFEGYKLLLVEDEAPVRRGLSQLLRAAGFTVEMTTGVQEAREAMDRDRVDVLVSDMVLPDGTGDELAHEARERWPGSIVVFISGYDPRLTPRPLPTGSLFFSKPVEVENILRQLRKELSELPNAETVS